MKWVEVFPDCSKEDKSLDKRYQNDVKDDLWLIKDAQSDLQFNKNLIEAIINQVFFKTYNENEVDD